MKEKKTGIFCCSAPVGELIYFFHICLISRLYNLTLKINFLIILDLLDIL